MIFNKNEKIVSVLGNNAIQTFLSTGVLGTGFAVLTDKRVYFKGKCLVRRGKGFYSKLEEKAVDLSDVTGTGFVHNRATWLKVLMILSWIGTAHVTLLMILMIIFHDFSFVDGLYMLSVEMVFVGISALLHFLYKRFNYSAFEISYAGGGIAFNMHWITAQESSDFQTKLRLLKDNINKQNISKTVNPVQDNSHKKSDLIPEKILQYKNLLDQGIITQEEFNAKKKQLLDITID